MKGSTRFRRFCGLQVSFSDGLLAAGAKACHEWLPPAFR
jgi:hypothetical protein